METIVHIWYRSSLNFKVVKAVVVASPGFVKDQFLDYLKQYSIKNDVKGIKRSEFASNGNEYNVVTSIP